MNKTITYGDYTYKYCLELQKRKSISITVFPNLEIAVAAPDDMAQEKIEDFFKNKWMWIEKQLVFFRQFQKTSSQKQYVSGESFLYLGRQYKLIVKKARESYVSLQQGRLYLNTTGAVRDGKKNEMIITAWYKNRAHSIFAERYAEMCKKFSYSDNPSLIIRTMEKRWGSYTKNNRVILNTRLIYASKKCIDYVIAHELCHVKYKNHDKNFYKLLDKKCPNWQKIQEDLEMRFVL